MSFNSKQVGQFVRNSNNFVSNSNNFVNNVSNNNNNIRKSIIMNKNKNNLEISPPRQSISPNNIYFRQTSPLIRNTLLSNPSTLPLTLQQPHYQLHQKNISPFHSSLKQNNYYSASKLLYPRPSLIIR